MSPRKRVLVALLLASIVGCSGGVKEGMPDNPPPAPGPPAELNGPMEKHRKEMSKNRKGGRAIKSISSSSR
jgi:predicted small lipoprotein YifL